jgi:hypothetical protein
VIPCECACVRACILGYSVLGLVYTCYLYMFHCVCCRLGAVHDGEDNSCSPTDRYIMAGYGVGPVPADKRLNPWHFSPCTVQEFKQFINVLLPAYVIDTGRYNKCTLIKQRHVLLQMRIKNLKFI